MQQCVICYSLIVTRAQINSCRHSFCFQCISQWAQIQNTCPICKKRFNKISKLLPTLSQRERVDQTQVLQKVARQQPTTSTLPNAQCSLLVDHSQGQQLSAQERLLHGFLLQATQNFNLILTMSRQLDSLEKEILARKERRKQRKLKKSSQ